MENGNQMPCASFVRSVLRKSVALSGLNIVWCCMLPQVHCVVTKDTDLGLKFCPVTAQSCTVIPDLAKIPISAAVKDLGQLGGFRRRMRGCTTTKPAGLLCWASGLKDTQSTEANHHWH